MKVPQYHTVWDSAGILHEGEGWNLDLWPLIEEKVEFKGRSVLDLGAAEGYFSRQCELLGSNVLACDLNPEMKKRFNQAWPLSRVRYLTAPVSGVLGSTKSVDFILALNLCHHFTVSEFLWFTEAVDVRTRIAFITTSFDRSSMETWDSKARPNPEWWKKYCETTSFTECYVSEPYRVDRRLVILWK
jgi:SAM-dependent methyltransferase